MEAFRSPSSLTSTLEKVRFPEANSLMISNANTGLDAAGLGPDRDRKTVLIMGDILDFDPPDLVVINGDLINGESTFLENSTHYVDQIVTPMVDRNLTWASTYGNHDHYYNITGDGIFERETAFPGARTDRMVDDPTAGVTNYYLPVYGSDCNGSDDCTPELLLWFFDSRGGYYSLGNARENWVDESVVAWFNETNAELVERYEKEIPSLAFVHVPIHASFAIQQEYGIDKNKQPGINYETVVQQGEGWCSDGNRSRTCDYGDQDVPFMRSLVSIPGIIALFYGHDHANSWCYKWDSQVPGTSMAGNGINLCYGQHTGYGGYGNWIRGGRQILVSREGLKDLAIDTHIRLESGDVAGRVSLNSSYNTDSYAATPNQMTYLSDARTTPIPSSAASHGLGGKYWKGYEMVLALALATTAWFIV